MNLSQIVSWGVYIILTEIPGGWSGRYFRVQKKGIFFWGGEVGLHGGLSANHSEVTFSVMIIL